MMYFKTQMLNISPSIQGTAVMPGSPASANGVGFSELLNLWIAVTEPGPQNVVFSSDGITWTQYAAVFTSPNPAGGRVAASNNNSVCVKTTPLSATLLSQNVIIGNAEITQGTTSLDGSLNVTGNLLVRGTLNISSTSVVVVGGSFSIVGGTTIFAIGRSIFGVI
jgi:hypothetical protein